MKSDSLPHAMAEYRQQLVADPHQFAAVRRTVRDRLRAWGWGCLVDATAMCVTELLSNVHRHVAPPECELSLVALSDGVRAAVSDGSPELPVLSDAPDWFSESGRGLFLLSETADAWGADLTPAGKQVWALLRAG